MIKTVIRTFFLVEKEMTVASHRRKLKGSKTYLWSIPCSLLRENLVGFCSESSNKIFVVVVVVVETTPTDLL